METLTNYFGPLTWLMPLIVICVLWDSVWKLIAMWKAGRNNEPVWFVCLAIFNTMGILPIIYILLNKSKTEETQI